MGDATKNVLDFLDFPPFWITFKLLYCTVLVHNQKCKHCWSILRYKTWRTVHLRSLFVVVCGHLSKRGLSPFVLHVFLANVLFFLQKRISYFVNTLINCIFLRSFFDVQFLTKWNGVFS